jgi:deazaflavin-dependent oxidoreductase (nitroreductase family)
MNGLDDNGVTEQRDSPTSSSRSGSESFSARLRHRSNPMMLPLAGGPWSPFGVVEHVGRRSGRSYEVPVEPFVDDAHVVIGLPWGADTNWAQNVIAAARCRMRWRGKTLSLTNPRIVGPDVALPLARGLKGRLLARLRLEHFLLLDR